MLFYTLYRSKFTTIMFLLLLSKATAVNTINNNIIIVKYLLLCIHQDPGSIHEQFSFILSDNSG